MEKSLKNRKKKHFLWGEGKYEINYKKKKKKKKFFLFSGAFSLFLVVRLPEKVIMKCFGVQEKE